MKNVSVRGWMPGEEAAMRSRHAMIERVKRTNPRMAKEMGDELESDERKAANGRPSCQGFTLAKSSAVPGRIFAPQVLAST